MARMRWCWPASWPARSRSRTSCSRSEMHGSAGVALKGSRRRESAASSIHLGGLVRIQAHDKHARAFGYGNGYPASDVDPYPSVVCPGDDRWQLIATLLATAAKMTFSVTRAA